MSTEVSPLATVTLDSSGNGQCSIGPPSGTRWALRLATVATSTAVKQPTCKLFRGSASGPIELVDFTFTGQAASSGKVGGATYFPGQVLWAVWSGGDVGATATLQVFGTQGSRSDPFEPAPVGEGFANNLATLVAAGASGAQIVITTQIPVELQTFYAGSNPVSAVLYYVNGTDYWYEIDFGSSVIQLHGNGFVIGGTVHENELFQWVAGSTRLDRFVGLNTTVRTQYGRPGRTPSNDDAFNIADSATLNINGKLKTQDTATLSLLDNLATRVKVLSQVTNDTNDRFEILTTGQQNWGPGNAATDVNLYRSAVGILRTDTDVSIGGNLDAVTSFAGTILPVNEGMSAWTFDPVAAQSSQQIAVGVVHLGRIVVSKTITPTICTVQVDVAGNTLTLSSLGVYNSSGTLLKAITGLSPTFQSTGVKDVSISGIGTLTPGTYYCALLIGTATTAPSFASGTGKAGLPNAGQTVAPFRYMTSGTGLTVLPGTITLSSGTASDKSYWFGLR